MSFTFVYSITWLSCFLLNLYFFIVFLHTGFTAATSMFTFVILIITIIICLSHICFGHFKYLSAHNYKVTKKPELCCRTAPFCLVNL